MIDRRGFALLLCACESVTSAGESGSSSTTAMAEGSSSEDGEPALPPGVVAFTDVTEGAGLAYVQGSVRVAPFCLLDDLSTPGEGDWCTPERMSGGVAVGDYDGDARPDLFVTRLDDPPLLLHNEGDGTFAEASAGIDGSAPSNGAAWLDVDRDGDLDLFVTTVSGSADELWIQTAPGRFRDEAIARGAAAMGEVPHVGQTPAVGDYDRDGWADLFVGEWRPRKQGGDARYLRLLHNVGDGVFEDATIAAGLGVLFDVAGDEEGVFAFAPALVDLDGDGWLDLAIASDHGTSRLLWNDGAGRFVDGTEAAGVGLDRNGMGSAFGDLDRDGDLDWFVSAIATTNDPSLGNRLYLNEGERRFTDATDAYAVRDASWAWGTAIADLDNDGALDIVVTAGWLPQDYADAPTKLWLGDAHPRRDTARDAGLAATEQGRGLALLDYDADGDLDIVVARFGSTPRLYRNDSTPRAFLRVRVSDEHEGHGAVVTVRATPGGPVQTRQIGASTHFLGQSERVAHFGLGAHEGPIATVEVRSPDGRVRARQDVEPNGELVIAIE